MNKIIVTICPVCKMNDEIIRNGKTKDNRQTYFCKRCKKRITANKKTERITKGKKRCSTKPTEFLAFKKLITENDNLIPPFKNIKLNISRQTFYRWSNQLIKENPKIQKYTITKDIKFIEALRTFSEFIKKRNNN